MIFLKAISFLFLAKVGESFTIPAWKAAKVDVLKASRKDDGDDILLVQLQHEYKVLQEQLMKDLQITHDEEDAELVEEHLLEIAEGANTLHKHKQYELLHEAEQELNVAESNMASARSLKRKALDHLISAEKQAKLMDEMDAAHHDMELLKGLAKGHNRDVDVIHEAERLELQFSFDELQAQHKINAAQFLLEDLQHNEEILQATLHKLREEKNNKMLAEHRSFLDKVKDVIYTHPDLFSSLDPHIL